MPALKQGDPRWGHMQLGSSGLKMESWGCTFTSGVMVAHAFGKQQSVVSALESMNREGGFDFQGNLYWQKFAQVLGLDFGYRWDTDANGSPSHSTVREMAGWRHINWLADVGIPTMVFVDTNHDGRANHWCAYIGDGMLNDPWDGREKPLESFGRLYGYAIMNGTPALTGTKYGAMVGKANEIAKGRNIELNSREILSLVNRP